MQATGKIGQPVLPRLPCNRTCCGHAKIDANAEQHSRSIAAGTRVVWRETTGMPLVVSNGNTKDCRTNSGPLASYNLDVSGMSIQIQEQDPDRHSSVIVKPVAR
jgi:hypothetical protein